MDNRLRFVFRGNAAAFGGHIIRPKEVVLGAPGSCLPVSGGHSEAHISKIDRDGLFGVESATTFAQGLFTDKEQFKEYTYHRVEQSSLVARTRVWADLRGFTVGRKPRMVVKHMRAELVAHSPRGSGQPSIALADVKPEGNFIEGISVDGHELVVELDIEAFRELDTYAKLLAAADKPEFVDTSGGALLMRTARKGEADPPRTGRLIQASPGSVYGTIVKEIHWARQGDEFPNSEIHGNMVILPEFGRAYFGELLISENSRRLTMVRLALGSDAGGDASGADVQDNGGWSWSP